MDEIDKLYDLTNTCEYDLINSDAYSLITYIYDIYDYMYYKLDYLIIYIYK